MSVFTYKMKASIGKLCTVRFNPSQSCKTTRGEDISLSISDMRVNSSAERNLDLLRDRKQAGTKDLF